MISFSYILILVTMTAIFVGISLNSKTTDSIDICDEKKFSEFRRQLYKYDSDDPHFDIEGEYLLGECVFRPSYEQARSLFRESAIAAGFTLETYDIHGDKYTTDVAKLEGNPKHVLVHISGIHGVEGYAGSGSQVAALQYFALRNTSRRALYAAKGEQRIEAPTIIFVHAINPFGMSNNRRVNEDNIDVNRNFLTDNELDMVRKRDPNFAGYVDVDFLINPLKQLVPGWIWLSDLHGLIKVAYAVAMVGIGSIKRSLVAGNYYKQEGLGFGGFTRSKSVETLIRLMKDMKVDAAEKVVLIDVHTGLGPPGVDTLVYFGTENAEREAHLRAVFPMEYRNGTSEKEIIGGIKESSKGSGEGSAMAGYELTIGTTDDFCRVWMAPGLEDNHRVCVTQEFGTVGVIQVGKALMDENYAFNHGTNAEKKVHGERLKSCFYVQTTSWARAVAHRGLAVILQAFDHLLVN